MEHLATQLGELGAYISGSLEPPDSTPPLHDLDSALHYEKRDEKQSEAGCSSNKKNGQRFFCTGYPPCNLSFTRSEHLARHIRKHTGERPFQCHCNRRFSRLGDLCQHAQTVHANKEIVQPLIVDTSPAPDLYVRVHRPGRSLTCTDNALIRIQTLAIEDLLRCNLSVPALIDLSAMAKATNLNVIINIQCFHVPALAVQPR